MTEWIIASSLGFVTGGAIIWLTKTKLQTLFLGASAVAIRLRMDASTIEATVKKF